MGGNDCWSLESADRKRQQIANRTARFEARASDSNEAEAAALAEALRDIRDAAYAKFGDVILFSNREYILGADVCKANLSVFVEVVGDGNCLYYVLFLYWQQLEPGETKAKTYQHLKNKVCFQSVTLRNFPYNIQLADFMERYRTFFEPFISTTKDFEGTAEDAWILFLDGTRQNYVYGEEIHMLAFALLFKCCIVLHKETVFASVMYLPLLLKSES
jgi:hypothetical protein